MRLIIIAVLFPIYLFSQTVENTIANSVCDNLSKLDFSDDINTLNQKAVKTIQYEYQNHQSKVRDLIKMYRTNSGLSQIEASKLIGQKMTIHLMDKCVPYQRITMFKSEPVPKISETAKMIGEEFTELLLIKSKSQKINSTLIDYSIVEVTEKHSQLIEKEYGNKYSKKFIKEFNAYLMTESKPYIKWTASNL